MSGLILEPFTAQLRFAFLVPKGVEEWTAILMRFLETLAALCHASGPCVIGHIKGLALLHGSQYIRVSVISPSLPAQAETNASGQTRELTATLTMLVYGLSRESLESMVEAAAARSETVWSGRVAVVPVSATYRSDRPDHRNGC